MNGAGQTLYLKPEQSSVVRERAVRLEDVAGMECSDIGILRKVKQMELCRFTEKSGARRVFSVLDVIGQIHETCPALEIVNLGAPDFVVCYEPDPEGKGVQYAKTALLCIVLFFGAAFTIMTFIQDVAVGEVFDRFYLRVTGVSAAGVTPLEISFCVGLAAGIMIFYNHIGRKKLTDDPTPIQVEMRKYEQDADNTYIETENRRGRD